VDAAIVANDPIGVGTAKPAAPVHVKQSGSSDPAEVLLLLDSDVAPLQVLRNRSSGPRGAWR
jgi:hypothetical protein